MAKWKDSTIRRRAEHKAKMEQYWRDMEEATRRLFSLSRKESPNPYEDSCENDYMIMGEESKYG